MYIDNSKTFGKAISSLVCMGYVWASVGHYNDVIMSTMAFQITSLPIVYSTVYSGTDQRKYQSSESLAFVGKSSETGEFHAKRASNAENVSIWWRHHGCVIKLRQNREDEMLPTQFLSQYHTASLLGYDELITTITSPPDITHWFPPSAISASCHMYMIWKC